MAMCFSLVALGAPVRINDPKCVGKTFPGYFQARQHLSAGLSAGCISSAWPGRGQAVLLHGLRLRATPGLGFAFASLDDSAGASARLPLRVHHATVRVTRRL